MPVVSLNRLNHGSLTTWTSLHFLRALSFRELALSDHYWEEVCHWFDHRLEARISKKFSWISFIITMYHWVWSVGCWDLWNFVGLHSTITCTMDHWAVIQVNVGETVWSGEWDKLLLLYLASSTCNSDIYCPLHLVPHSV